MARAAQQPVERQREASKNNSKSQCSLTEVIQYDCELTPREVLCSPIRRVFRKCAGRPAIEVTHAVVWEGSRPTLSAAFVDALPPVEQSRI